MSGQKIQFTAAIQAIRARGVKVVQNATDKVRNDRFGMTEEDFDTKPLAWTDGRQGGTYTWRDDRPAYVSRRGTRQDLIEPLSHLFINHGNGAGQIVAEEFRARGFEVQWDGTESKTVTIIFPEVKSYRVWRS